MSNISSTEHTTKYVNDNNDNDNNNDSSSDSNNNDTITNVNNGCDIRATETMLAETMLADLRARAAWVCCCTCTGYTTRRIPLFSSRHFLSGATRARAAAYPCSPCA